MLDRVPSGGQSISHNVGRRLNVSLPGHSTHSLNDAKKTISMAAYEQHGPKDNRPLRNVNTK
jgi:hypothetical protein